MPWM